VNSHDPVNSHNEWDPLEEIIVGRLDGLSITSAHSAVSCNIPGMAARAQSLTGDFRFPGFMIDSAQQELDGFVHVLEQLGVKVRRPDLCPHKPTQDLSSRSLCHSSPRDSMLVIGNEILETPMAWPCRYFETHSYRTILKDYFRRGARLTSAPKPQLNDDLFDPNFSLPEPGEPSRYILTESDPAFDAADFLRCGRDIFLLRSSVTNALGIDWLRRYLGKSYRVHEIQSRCPHSMPLDTMLLPLGPGRLLINPEYIDPDELPGILKKWDIFVMPEPDPIDRRIPGVTPMCGNSLGMNLLVIDEERVIVDPNQDGMMRAMDKWGFEPIPVPFLHYAAFGGNFHCASLDVRRRGTLQSYFD
jgi:glycine amidinotransferase